VLAVVLGLASGLSWGVADFVGGLASRRVAAIAVVATTQSAGLVVAVVAIAATATGPPPADQILFGLAAGAIGGVGLVAFYRGLAVGSMTLIAPISALGALVPVTVDLASGRDPGPVVLAGMVVALAGACLAAAAPGRAVRRGLGLAVIAALGFGSFFTLFSRAAEDGPLWALGSARVASVPLALLAVGAVGATLRMPGRTLALVAGAGLLEAAANLMFAAGTREGLTSVVAVLGSLYPVTTVALASIVLGERLGRLQAAGAGAALVGVVLIAAG
jgi:drug/metabolite transporter (DMT)-like permease